MRQQQGRGETFGETTVRQAEIGPDLYDLATKALRRLSGPSCPRDNRRDDRETSDSETTASRGTTVGQPAPEPSPDLPGAILGAVTLGGALTGRELALRVGRPEPSRFYDVLAELIEAGLLETDPRSCRYYLPGCRP